jgi:hypothetical protein
MRILIVVLAGLFLLLPLHLALAKANHRSAIDQKWKQVQAEQERQKREWRGIEREAERVQRDTGSGKGIIHLVPSGGRQWQCP